MSIPESFYGHTAEPVVAYVCGDCGRNLHEKQDGTFEHQPRGGYGPYGDHTQWEKVQSAAAKAAKLAAAIPYSGTSVKRCQSSVWEQGRAPHTWRCTQTKNLSVIQSDGHPMVVCKVHVKSPGSRWAPTGHFMERRGDPPANEPIEPEYLAQLPKVEKGGQSAH